MNHYQYYSMIAGVDEAGVGPLAGPVYAAAVILDPQKPIFELKDSKLIPSSKREIFYQEITQQAIAWSIATANTEEIDQLNILQASLLAMRRAVMRLKVKPEYALIDGKYCPKVNCGVENIIKGDQTIPAIMAASILAKVARDKEMIMLDEKYPGYGLAIHKGYSTKIHLEALKRLGPTPIHRKSFAPVKALL